MSPEVEAAFPEQAQALYAGFQEPYQHPATVDDVCRYPPVGRNACNEEEVRWFEATYDLLQQECCMHISIFQHSAFDSEDRTGTTTQAGPTSQSNVTDVLKRLYNPSPKIE